MSTVPMQNANGRPSELVCRSGNAYPSDQSGVVNVQAGQDVTDAINNGWIHYTGLVSNTPTAYNVDAGTTAHAATAVNFTGGQDVTLNMSGTLAGAANLTTPTAVAILALLSNPVIGQGYVLRIINASAGAFAWTLVAGAGVTLSGTMSIAQSTFRDFNITVTSLTTIKIQSVGTGTNS